MSWLQGESAPVLALLVVLAAAAERWWSGRRLLPFVDDPALSERLITTRRQSAAVFVAAAATLLLIAPGSFRWTVPLLVVTRMAAGFPARQVLYAESWSLAGYLWFFARLIACFFGFWSLLVLFPMLAASARPRSWIVALPIAAALLAWNRYSSAVIRYVLAARPLKSSTLASRFSALAANCSVPAPRFEQVDLGGGTLANAVALASQRGAAVLFTDTLLDSLDEDEAAAICAHELAHLEHFDTRRLRRLDWANLGLIAAGTIAALATSVASPVVISAAWVSLLVVILGWRARNRQRNETTSDRRAVALTGDAEALVRALTKLHMLARIPRRLDPGFERRATHPSLARRIRDIRKAAGASPVALETGASFTSPDGRTIATFEEGLLEWREGEAATHALAYPYLSELRIQATRSGPARLLVVENGGRRWEMALAGEDLARAQQALDAVDGRISDAAPSVRQPRILRPLTAVLAVLAVIVTLPALLGGFDAVRLHDSSRANPAAVGFLVSFAVALLLQRKRILTAVALGAVLLAGTLAFARSTGFLDYFARDPLLVRADPISIDTIHAQASSEFSVPFFASDLRISPSGTRVAVVAATEDDDEQTTMFRVGAVGGTLEPVAAQEIVFVNDEHALLSQAERNGITVRQVTVDPIADVWQQHVPDLHEARLTYSSATRSWRLLGRDGQRRIVRAEGTVGEPGVRETRWPVPEGMGGAIDAIGAAGERVLVSEVRFEPGVLHRSRMFRRWAWLLQPPSRESRFWTLDDRGPEDVAVTRFAAQCLDRVLGDDRLVCSAFDGTDTRFVAIDPAKRRTDPVALLRGRLQFYQSPSPGWLSGWCEVRPIALRLVTRTALLPPDDPQHRVTHVTASDYAAGTISFDGTRSIVRIYPLN